VPTTPTGGEIYLAKAVPTIDLPRCHCDAMAYEQLQFTVS
jgi:hypothetical protein